MSSRDPRNKWYPRRPGRTKYAPNFRRYELEKQQWIAHHPEATGQEYTLAMREIAARCGI